MWINSPPYPCVPAVLDLTSASNLSFQFTQSVGWNGEAFAIEYLASAMEAGCLGQAPIWTDLRTFDGRPWRETVDFLTAGYPCQPFSIAGKRRGQDDPRHLWPHVYRVIGEVEPAIVFLENVPGHLSLGFDQVASDLEDLGYEIAAGLFSAEEVGASQERLRLFIVGNRDNKRLEGRCLSECSSSNKQTTGTRDSFDDLFPPRPDATDKWLQYLSNRPWRAPAIEPGVCRLVDGLARTEYLRLLGNGVVPLQAAYAFCSLWAALQSD